MSTIRLTWQNPDTGQLQEYDGALPVVIGRKTGSGITLDSPHVSREHAHIEQQGNTIIITDLGSRNGVVINGQRTRQAALHHGTRFNIGPFVFAVHLPDEATAASDYTLDETEYMNDDTSVYEFREATQPHAVDPHQSTVAIDAVMARDLADARPSPGRQADRFPPPAFHRQIIPMADIYASGLPITETTYLAVGGGLGSFIWVDNLRIAGVPAEQIKALGFEPKPYGRYARLCQNSQIPPHERIRSDSGSTPDCIWGWPGYAMREIVTDIGEGRIGHALKMLKRIFVEPVLDETYTPKAGRVFASIDREANRINWERIWCQARVRAIRKTDDGRYAIAYSEGDFSRPGQHRIMLATYLHIAVGYPGIRILDDLQVYRDQTGDRQRVVNAYEEHDHLYRELERNGGTVMIRGRGIVASRIIQRLYEARQINPNIGILHLMRTPLKEGGRYKHAQRAVKNHWEFQPFNWPKACWGGTLRAKLESASDEERSKLLDQWGGTTTADRRDWQYITETGLSEGWYDIAFGAVHSVEPGENGKVITRVRGHAKQPSADYVTDYIIDATGLEASLESNALYADLIGYYDLRRNKKGRLFVSNNFEIEGMRNHQGRMYASGVMTLGGPFAAVDSFLGLQFAAMQSVDELRRLRAPSVRGTNGFRSLRQYIRWAAGARP